MIAIVFLVASFTGKRTTTVSGPVEVFDVTLERDASQEAIIAVAEQLDNGMEAAVLRDLGVSEAQLFAARDDLLAELIDVAREEYVRDIQAFRAVWRFVEDAVRRMPDHVVADAEAQSQFIATLNLPDDTDDSLFRYLLMATPDQRKTRSDAFAAQANRPVEDLMAEFRDAISPLAERQTLRQMICDRSAAYEPKPSERPRQGLTGVTSSCSVFVIRYIEGLLPETLDEEALLRARVLSVLTLAQSY